MLFSNGGMARSEVENAEPTREGEDLVMSSDLFDRLEDYDKADTDGHHLMLTAEQIARACVEAHKENNG